MTLFGDVSGKGAPLNAARPAEERAALLAWVKERLHEEYGDQDPTPRRDPMHELISTILSQRTTHADEEAAYQELRTLGDWDAITLAPTDAVAHAIRRSNYPESKAPRIQETLRRIKAAPGGYDLDFLRDLPVKDALKWLTDLPGVGVKTASLVLLFNYARPVFPVDTHVHRVSTRVGVIPRMGEQAAHRALLALLPPDPPYLYELHINFLSHGRQVCTWTRPKCGKCILRERCDAYALYGDKVPSFSEKPVKGEKPAKG
ncbi:endonuclease III domain-containing protein [Deinococcus radiodurans]|uniref:Endonuclease III n=1 Tax=Deinococcus radiodurans (strain ATCC 13939 / DSM 20539 / JCM 16871 / CCUG 27074 / LMG 4051 / NBRC 15346 / NCIMB 9279 / VKM B-1422 / R1) TaxID=243230 RepID=Q9RRQ0_DEIRA|nr:endonuclease III [Deinococcus radiodurans]AAF11977.1 endonuclease III [Deinococcus radiodurans R1 = ATCC 13939 = DSM 20539]ANC70525.1 endonuclease III [Deinococcus radiodurans R1 = ATCC 13939 = DSM 20539]QEM71809.1 endonuclease III [Deinococcus radiodurans]QIP28093.1 endonuclease III [Deinococcus radiodurans]QIP31027.1 endonuclease III [Deinococcus radiodurans]